jgi:hypothetical protein
MISPVAERAITEALNSGKALLKFISPNNVGLTGSHECGYYLPKSAWKIYTEHPPVQGENKESTVEITWQDGRVTDSRVKWYGRAKSEYRLTRFGKDFPYLAADTVGDLLVLIPRTLYQFSAYVLDLDEDIGEIQAALGVEAMDGWAIYEAGADTTETADECIERHFREFCKKVTVFPSTITLSDEARKALIDCIRDFDKSSLDERLIDLIQSEYRLFRLVERQVCQQDIVRPFKDVDDFLSTASSIMNRRKVRAGRSLENHVETLLRGARIPFDVRPQIDGRIQPDILIPSKASYEDPAFPVEKLCVVGVKTTCKDRWRQVLNEAKRIRKKHILTIQPGISGNQLNEMNEAGVTLIVPKKLHADYPGDGPMKILTLEQFVSDMRNMVGTVSVAADRLL